MEFLPINIDAKNIIKDFFNTQKIQASDLLFGNLYIWHFSREIKYTLIEDNLIVLTKFKDEPHPFIFYPLGKGDRKKSIQKLQEYFFDNKMPFFIRSMEEFQKKELMDFFGEDFNITSNRNRFDYIYKIKDLIHLNGRKLHNKKNHLNRFFNLYPDFVYEEINTNNTKEVLETYTKWLNENPKINDGLKNEYIGIQASLNNFSLLDMKGAIIRIDGRIAAFSLGEQINEDSVVIHIEKGNIFYSGIYQAINQQFLANTWSNLEFVNREEDLGLEGLRKAKMTYQPFKFIEKYEAILRSN